MARHDINYDADIARGTKLLAEALAGKDDVELTCRGMRHAWKESGLTWQMPTERYDLPVIRLNWTCSRGCGVKRQDLLTVKPARRNRSYSIVSRSVGHYTYPEGYQIPGIPRGVKPSTVIWQEYVRRAMENAANAAPGERERSA